MCTSTAPSIIGPPQLTRIRLFRWTDPSSSVNGMDIRELDRRALAAVDKIAGTVIPADLDRPTPCAGWTLRDLLQHQVSENLGFALAVREGSTTDWHGGSLGSDPYRSYADQSTTCSTRSTKTYSTSRSPSKTSVPSPEVAVSMHLVDSVAHGWDIAKTWACRTSRTKTSSTACSGSPSRSR